MSKTYWIITIVSGIAILIGLAACHPRAAYNYKGHFGTDQERAEYRLNYAVERITKKLDLNEAQQKRVREMAEVYKSKIETIHQTREKSKAKVIALVSQEQITPEEIKAMVRDKIEQHRAMLDLMAENLAELHGMLTPEQRAKLVEAIKTHEHGRCRFGDWKNS